MLRLPHPEVTALLDPIKRDVIRIEQWTVDETALSYAVFRSEAERRPFPGHQGPPTLSGALTLTTSGRAIDLAADQRIAASVRDS